MSAAHYGRAGVVAAARRRRCASTPRTSTGARLRSAACIGGATTWRGMSGVQHRAWPSQIATWPCHDATCGAMVQHAVPCCNMAVPCCSMLCHVAACRAMLCVCMRRLPRGSSRRSVGSRLDVRAEYADTAPLSARARMFNAACRDGYGGRYVKDAEPPEARAAARRRRVNGSRACR
jgi:hypothetical protein